MTEEEAKKLRDGDRVLLECEIIGAATRGYSDPEPYVSLQTIDRTPESFSAYVSTIHSIVPRPLRLGDRVVMVNSPPGTHTIGEIIGLAPGHAWVTWPDETHPTTCILAELERIP